MGFFALKQRAKTSPSRGVNFETLHRAQCNACPLNNQAGLKHPHMEPTGSPSPIVYMLGEAPGKQEDESGRQFVGQAGKLLRQYIPEEWLEELRWNNCVRTRPPGNATPGVIELECCRPSIEADIAMAKPKAIFGFGGVPLGWALKQTGILKWCGRMIPVNIAGHSCWYFPMMHPSYVMRKKNMRERKWNEAEEEFQFRMDMARAWATVEAGLPEPIVHTPEQAKADIKWYDGHGQQDLDLVLKWLADHERDRYCGLDYETNVLRPYSDDAAILTVALSVKDETLAFPISHPGAGWSDDDLKALVRGFKRFLRRFRGPLISHQLAFELEWTLMFFGEDLAWREGGWEDSVSQAYILDERMKMGKPDAHSLEFLGIQYFGINLKKISEQLNRAKLENEQLDQVLVYNGIDAKYHRLLFFAQRHRLKAEKLQAVYKEHMKRVVASVLTQIQGVPVNQKVVESFYRRLTRRKDKIEAKLTRLSVIKKFEKLAGHPFRPSATADAMLLCRKLLKVFPDKADEAELKKIKHPAISLLLRWRKVNKTLSTYVLPVRAGAANYYSDGLIHPMLETTRTRTWRTSSGDPNIQNWPKRNERQKEVRKQIRPDEGYKVVSFDYGQIQARNVGMESLDDALVKAFWNDYDIHADWTWRIEKVHKGWIKEGVEAAKADAKLFKAYRNRSKNELVFPSFFGAGASSIAISLGISKEEAQKLHNDFWQKFPDIHKWHKKIKRDYERKGYVTGLTGFRRRAPISQNKLINAPIQADEAMIVLDAHYRCCRAGFVPTMEIHDDLTFIWPADRIEANATKVIKTMLACPFKWANVVPIVVEMSVGDDWFSLKDVGAFRSDKWSGDLREIVEAEVVNSWTE